MVQITIEYMILVPVLILILFLFPIAVTSIMGTWVDSRRSLELREAASHLGSSIQQVYLSLNHTSIQAGTLQGVIDVPRFIEGYVFKGNASLRTAVDPVLDPTRILDITLKYIGLGITATTSITLGQNVEWLPSTFSSNSTNACLNAQKLLDGTIRLSFGDVT
jgi:hypothetical protein